MTLAAIKRSCIALTLLVGTHLCAEDTTLNEVLMQHVQALGGSYKLEQLTAVYVEGEQQQGEDRFRFVMRKKQPNMIRFTLSDDQMEAVAGYDGVAGWMSLQLAEERSIFDLTGPALLHLLAEARFVSPLVAAYLDDRGLFEYKGEVVEDGEVMVVLESKAETLNGMRHRYFLDKRDYLLRKQQELDALGENTLTTVYTDYREVDGYPFAFQLTNYVGEDLVSTQKIDQVIVNPGILSFYFKKPRD